MEQAPKSVTETLQRAGLQPWRLNRLEREIRFSQREVQT